MRTILRFSVDNERNGALRNALTAILIGAGFVRGQNTATYEHAGIGEANLANVLNQFWARAATHRGTGRIDHFWLYSDNNPANQVAQANQQAAAALGIDVN